MKIVIAPDSFKGSLSALQVARALERGVKRVLPKARCTLLPLADGGEGTTRSLRDALGGRWLRRKITGPHRRPVSARYALLADGQTAVIEMAEASGLCLLEGRERNPLQTTTYGTGELIRAALDRAARTLIIGLGGSATCDGGAGMAQALGVRLLDGRDREIRKCATGGMLHEVQRIDISGLDPRLRKCQIRAACDVNNVLCGPRGAARVFAPQKGATPPGVARLDRNLKHFARLLQRDLGIDVARLPGSGAAGGLGGGLHAFAGAKLESGVKIVLEATGLAEHLRGADLIITGEGRIDSQTVYGKTPAGVAQLAQKHGVPVLAVGGALADDARQIFEHGVDALEAGVARDMSLEEALGSAQNHLAAAAERALRLIRLGRGLEQKRQARRSGRRSPRS